MGGTSSLRCQKNLSGSTRCGLSEIVLFTKYSLELGYTHYTASPAAILRRRWLRRCAGRRTCHLLLRQHDPDRFSRDGVSSWSDHVGHACSVLPAAVFSEDEYAQADQTEKEKQRRNEDD